MVVYVTIFSSTTQPTGQPTNFALCATDFSVTVVHKFLTPNFPLTKKRSQKQPCVLLGAYKLPQNTPVFLEGVSELLHVDIQCPSWKYNNGSIFKKTPGFNSLTSKGFGRE